LRVGRGAESEKDEEGDAHGTNISR
jgi:hypothetical protein